jgi:hypothetical protein
MGRGRDGPPQVSFNEFSASGVNDDQIVSNHTLGGGAYGFGQTTSPQYLCMNSLNSAQVSRIRLHAELTQPVKQYFISNT